MPGAVATVHTRRVSGREPLIEYHLPRSTQEIGERSSDVEHEFCPAQSNPPPASRALFPGGAQEHEGAWDRPLLMPTTPTGNSCFSGFAADLPRPGAVPGLGERP
ncbi:hypothetical protein SY2F82_67880 [Streptomyces sp. Y2F8-2]|nr:hypothetical protein SY2F82_67880 [Streptomyces sp. Y2F8-2]